jgi:hypothetical protein
LEPEMEMKLVEFFLFGLVCLITRWMEHIWDKPKFPHL